MSAPPVKTPYQGGCFCGAIRYECTEAPIAVFNCHCRDCQRASGGAFVTVALVRESSLRVVSGQAKYHRVIGEGGRWTDRGFCAAYIPDFLATSDGLALVRAFMQIGDSALRRSIVRLVEDIVGDMGGR